LNGSPQGEAPPGNTWASEARAMGQATPRVQNLTGGSVNSSTGPAYRQNMGQFDHMAQQPSRCPRLDGGVNYGHFDPQGGPSNHQ
jgi:hypothetical protein